MSLCWCPGHGGGSPGAGPEEVSDVRRQEDLLREGGGRSHEAI